MTTWRWSSASRNRFNPTWKSIIYIADYLYGEIVCGLGHGLSTHTIGCTHRIKRSAAGSCRKEWHPSAFLFRRMAHAPRTQYRNKFFAISGFPFLRSQRTTCSYQRLRACLSYCGPMYISKSVFQ